MIDQPNDMLRHMLGLPAFRWADEPPSVPHRDYAAIGHDDPMFLQMERDGLVSRYRRCTSYDWWQTTDAGKAAAHASVERRKRTPAKRRYDRWLSIADCLGMTFGEYLKSNDPHIVEHRRG